MSDHSEEKDEKHRDKRETKKVASNNNLTKSMQVKTRTTTKSPSMQPAHGYITPSARALKEKSTTVGNVSGTALELREKVEEYKAKFHRAEEQRIKAKEILNDEREKKKSN